MSLTQERLKELLHYDPETGAFTRAVSRHGGRHKAGVLVGCPTAKGYLRVRIEGELHYLHRLAFLYVTGAWPEGVVDHLDGNNQNNRWGNLRDVPQRVNAENHRRARCDSRSKLIGAFPCSRSTTGRHYSKIVVRGKVHLLGNYATAEEAHAAYVKAKRELHEGNTL